MKHLLFTACVLFFTASVQAQQNFTFVVKQETTNKPIANAKIFIGQDVKRMNTYATNDFGEAIAELEPGKYCIKIAADGLDSFINQNFQIKEDGNFYFFVLQKRKLEEKVAIVSNEKIVKTIVAVKRKRPALHISKPSTTEAAPESVTKKDVGKISLSGGRASHTEIIVDGTMVRNETDEVKSISIEAAPLATPPTTLEQEIYYTKKMKKEIGVPYKPKAERITAGKLTTGEVNDFTKWNLYDEVSRDQLYSHLGTWQFFMERRYCVQAVNTYGKPIVNAKAILYCNGSPIWEVLTDNTGKAELWANPQQKNCAGKLTVQVQFENETYKILSPMEFSKGVNIVPLQVECNYSNEVDVAFVVDATGSMGDEINYLKAEVNDIIARTKNINRRLEINTAAVFYQDVSDVYVTHKSDFTANIATTTNFINQHYSGDGGDFPEAVDEALQVAIHELTWRKNSRAKIIFLVLDAPPHSTSKVQQRMYQLIAAAAKKGIRIIPVAGSGIDKNTEYIMRSMALATNGSYTFLTNNSGVGESHIEPTTDGYRVEKMNDLLIRLLTQFTFIPDCENNQIQQTELQKNDNPFSEWDVTTKVNIYPNPTTGIFMVDVPKECTEILLTDMSGKIMRRITGVEEAKMQVDISNFPVGIYFVRLGKNGAWKTGKVIKN